MFNDILTGRATNEPPPQTVEPYRTESVPQIKLTCIGCLKTYTANAGTPPGHCRICEIDIAQARTAQNARAVREIEERFARRDNSSRIVKWVVWGVIAIGLGFVKYSMRSEQRDAAARVAGYENYAEYQSLKDEVYPSDDFSYQVKSFADEACYCKDLACVRDVEARYSQFTRRNSPTDDMSRASAGKDTARLFDCAAALEQANTATAAAPTER